MNLSWYDEPDRWFNTARKFTNTNGKFDEIFLLVDCNEFYRHDTPSLYSLVNTDETISLVYTEGITMEKKKLKKNQKVRWHVIYTDDITNDINSVSQIHP